MFWVQQGGPWWDGLAEVEQSVLGCQLASRSDVRKNLRGGGVFLDYLQSQCPHFRSTVPASYYSCQLSWVRLQLSQPGPMPSPPIMAQSMAGIMQPSPGCIPYPSTEAGAQRTKALRLGVTQETTEGAPKWRKKISTIQLFKGRLHRGVSKKTEIRLLY